MAKKITIFEEQLYNTKSHHFNYYNTILVGAQKTECQILLIANKKASKETQERLGGQPLLCTMAGLSANQEEHVENRLLRSVLLAKNIIANFLTCRSVLKSQKKTDMVLCLSTWAPHVLLFLLLGISSGQRMGRVGLLFVWYPKIGAKRARSFKAIRMMLLILKKVHPETSVYAETKYAQKAWQEFLGFPVGYVVHPVEVPEELAGDRILKIEDSFGDYEPHERENAKLTTEDIESTEGEIGLCMASQAGASESDSLAFNFANSVVSESLTCSASIPAFLPATRYSSPATEAKPLVFGFYGFARHEQGVDVLMKALEILKSRGECFLEFRIVWPHPFQMPDGSWLGPEMFEHLKENVRFIEKALSPREYQEQLSQTDWLVLPYRVRSYQGRCSRISIEACVFGIPVIYTTCTDLEEVVANYGAGIGVEENDAEALANAISKATCNNIFFLKRAKDRVKYARKYFSSSEFINVIYKGNGI